jgi:hypothetical protein
MKRPRISLGLLMAVVVLVAVDFAAIRSLLTSNVSIQIAIPARSPAGNVIQSVSPIVFALGVIPMATVLLLCALMGLPGLFRDGTSSSFLFGFEVFGWASVFVFIACCALATSLVDAYFRILVSKIEPAFIACLAGAPEWLVFLSALSCVAVIFSLPELLLALIGGWLTRRLGITIVRQRRPAQEPEPIPAADLQAGA